MPANISIPSTPLNTANTTNNDILLNYATPSTTQETPYATINYDSNITLTIDNNAFIRIPAI